MEEIDERYKDILDELKSVMKDWIEFVIEEWHLYWTDADDMEHDFEQANDYFNNKWDEFVDILELLPDDEFTQEDIDRIIDILHSELDNCVNDEKAMIRKHIDWNDIICVDGPDEDDFDEDDEDFDEDDEDFDEDDEDFDEDDEDLNENVEINETLQRQYTCQPKDKDELLEIILQRIEKEGFKCNLNDIDTSKITDMSLLFNAAEYEDYFKNFNGDISQWDVSNVTNMSCMFLGCRKFNCDISKWNVSNVEYMDAMFRICERFNRDLSNWDVSNVKNMGFMFYGCKRFNSDLSSWNVSNVEDTYYMFFGCEKFNGDISRWNVSNMTDTHGMFAGCINFNRDLSQWDVSNVKYMDGMFISCPTKPSWYNH